MVPSPTPKSCPACSRRRGPRRATTALDSVAGSQRPKYRAGIELIDLGDTIFDVIRSRHVLHFQLRLRPLHLFAQRPQHHIPGSRISRKGRKRQNAQSRIAHEIIARIKCRLLILGGAAPAAPGFGAMGWSASALRSVQPWDSALAAGFEASFPASLLIQHPAEAAKSVDARLRTFASALPSLKTASPEPPPIPARFPIPLRKRR